MHMNLCTWCAQADQRLLMLEGWSPIGAIVLRLVMISWYYSNRLGTICPILLGGC